MQPQTRYAKSGNVHIAYQAFGEGSLDLVFVPGFVSNIESYWEEPSFAAWLRKLASFSRVITFDKRGTGLSDRVDPLPTMDKRMDDVRAVMDAAGSARAAVFGLSEGGSLATLFAAHYPERCRALVLSGAFAKFSHWFPTPERLNGFYEYVEKNWGTGANINAWAPGKKDDPAFREWWAKRERVGASPAAVVALMRMNSQIDISGPITNRGQLLVVGQRSVIPPENVGFQDRSLRQPVLIRHSLRLIGNHSSRQVPVCTLTR